MSFNIAELFDLEYWRQLLSVDVFSVPFFVNILDVLVVWYLVYKLIQMVQGTKAIQLFKGVVMFIAVRFLAEIIGLNTLSWLMDQVITYGVIAAIVIFQPEIRRGLEHLGRTTFLVRLKQKQTKEKRWYKPLIRLSSICQNVKLVR
ncbi:hypothetical protein GCM10025857_57330 [Alicyclobacillus contaminans]|nr:hypothetical protein GCM10025857_57330 [Alicyclobacillus contaminans]